MTLSELRQHMASVIDHVTSTSSPRVLEVYTRGSYFHLLMLSGRVLFDLLKIIIYMLFSTNASLL